MAQFLVPAGRYRVRAMRGLTWQPVEQEVVVEPGAVARAVLEFGSPPPEWAAAGWLAGDHHVHLFFHGRTQYPLMTIPVACHVARAEGLDYLCFQAELAWLRRHVDKNPDFTAGDFIAEVGHEITTDFWGHVNYVNAVGVPDLPMPPALWPANYQIRSLVDRDESMLVYTHPFGGLTEATAVSRLADPAVGLLARGLPVDVLLGQQVMVDLLSGSTADMAYKMEILARLWNLGFKFGVGGSSDAYVDQGALLPGGFRTLVLPSARDFAAIARAYRAGRTSATNGPLLRLTVDDHPVGDTLVLDAPRTVQVDVWAHSWWGLSALEIVHDAAVVAEIPAGPKAGPIDARLDLPIHASGWLYARAWGPPAADLRNVRDTARAGQLAMTSPVWLTVRDRPQPIRTDDIEFFDRWLDAVADALPGYRQRLLSSGQFGSADDLQRDVQHAQVMLHAARQALHAVGQRATGGKTTSAAAGRATATGQPSGGPCQHD
ncbi:MAG: hypothetical protein A2W31_01920 [Planctomycetes bacterium RBG_16_64_10]|nr:MAG: hypothetical protein A2W31_01920 [Planctomycetes bacterium RBG_16_64_10]